MSKLSNYASYFGQRYLTGTLLTIGSGSAVVTLFSNTVFVDNYKEFFQLYRRSYPLEVSDEVNALLGEVSEDLELPIWNPKVKLFHSIGHRLGRFGTAWSDATCYIGLPVNFSYQTSKDIDQDILIDGKPVPWNKEEGDLLKASLLLSKEAKKYAIAHELKLAHGPILYLYAIYPAVVIVALVFVNNLFIDKVIASRNPKLFLKVFYCFLIVFGIGFHFLLKDCTTKFLEIKADIELARTNEEYLLGGKEFLEKQLLMNKALRALSADGSSEYTEEGEEIHWIRRKFSPISQRLKIFVNQLNYQRLQKSQESSSSEKTDS